MASQYSVEYAAVVGFLLDVRVCLAGFQSGDFPGNIGEVWHFQHQIRLLRSKLLSTFIVVRQGQGNHTKKNQFATQFADSPALFAKIWLGFKIKVGLRRRFGARADASLHDCKSRKSVDKDGNKSISTDQNACFHTLKTRLVVGCDCLGYTSVTTDRSRSFPFKDHEITCWQGPDCDSRHVGILSKGSLKFTNFQDVLQIKLPIHHMTSSELISFVANLKSLWLISSQTSGRESRQTWKKSVLRTPQPYEWNLTLTGH